MKWFSFILSLLFLQNMEAKLPSEKGEEPKIYLESLYPGWGQSFGIGNVIHREQSDFWDLILFENEHFGRVLAIDGVIQLTEKDEAIYSEMMAHVPILSHENPSSVLIVGGGDGCILREVLKHKNIERVVLVEIDRSVIEISQKYLPDLIQGAFDDPRVEVVIEDASLFVKRTDELFDIIISDSTDPVGPAKVLFSEPFFKDCKNRLKEKGIMVNQNGVPFLQKDELYLTVQNRDAHFDYISYYVAPVPTYVGGFMAFGWASDHGYWFSFEELEKRLSLVEGTMKYYNPSIHLACFALPNYFYLNE